MIIAKRSFGICIITLLSSIGFQLNSYAETKMQQHVVAEGQTLTKIADFYNTDVESIRQANLLRNDRITAGQLLKIPINLNAPIYHNNQPKATSNQAPTRQAPPPNTNKIQKYQVKSGETLSLIAQRFNISINDIAVANDITDVNNIPIGTQLFIPAKGYASLTQNNTRPAVQQRTQTQQREYINYQVSKGDTLSGIANRQNMSIQELANYNNKPLNYKVRLGEILKIPNRAYYMRNNTRYQNQGKY